LRPNSAIAPQYRHFCEIHLHPLEITWNKCLDRDQTLSER
jgi:hypothetical protein